MTSATPSELRSFVIERAQNRCEYCGLSQIGQEATFHVDHVVPRAAGGATTASNLALSCVGCSLHKAARQSWPDPTTSTHQPLFNPRAQDWSDHFDTDGAWVRGMSPTGRATVDALQMNRQLLLEARSVQTELARRSPTSNPGTTPPG